jgi:hypothetical protein
VLSPWVQAVSTWLPLTRALHAARLCLVGQAPLLDPHIAGDLSYLVALGVLTLRIGALLFGLGMRKAFRDGSLTRWS